MSNQEFKTGEILECVNDTCAANYGSIYNPKLKERFTLSIEKSILDNTEEYYLINKDLKKLTYPYKRYELLIFFKKII